MEDEDLKRLWAFEEMYADESTRGQAVDMLGRYLTDNPHQSALNDLHQAISTNPDSAVPDVQCWILETESRLTPSISNVNFVADNDSMDISPPSLPERSQMRLPILGAPLGVVPLSGVMHTPARQDIKSLEELVPMSDKQESQMQYQCDDSSGSFSMLSCLKPPAAPMILKTYDRPKINPIDPPVTFDVPAPQNTSEHVLIGTLRFESRTRYTQLDVWYLPQLGTHQGVVRVSDNKDDAGNLVQLQHILGNKQETDAYISQYRELMVAEGDYVQYYDSIRNVRDVKPETAKNPRPETASPPPVYSHQPLSLPTIPSLPNTLKKRDVPVVDAPKQKQKKKKN